MSRVPAESGEGTNEYGREERSLFRTESGDSPSALARQASPARVAGGRAHSYDEFTTLREVVVGTALNGRIPTNRDASAWLNLYGAMRFEEAAGTAVGRFPTRIIDETEEDLHALVTTLESVGVVVHRPVAVPHDREFATPHWRSEGFYSYCPRDVALVVGSMIIETPSPMRARYFETAGLKPIFQQFMLHGSQWIAAPRPELRDELYSVDTTGLPRLGELEPAFDAANVLRCGRDIFYQVSSSGNELGLIWLETLLESHGEFVIHPLRGIYDYAHIDSTIALLRPGLALINPERLTEASLPNKLRKWDILWCPPMEDVSDLPPHPLSSPWIGMNLLMLTPELAVVDSKQRQLVQELEQRGISVLPHRLRHARTLGGGFHCVTLDLVRDGELVGYFD